MFLHSSSRRGTLSTVTSKTIAHYRQVHRPMSVLQFCTRDSSKIPIVPDNGDGIYLIGQKTKYYIGTHSDVVSTKISKNAYARWFATAHDAFWSAFVCMIKCCTGGRDVIIIIIINEKKQNK